MVCIHIAIHTRKAHTESAKKWLEILEDKSVPVLVCLTYADKLYAECMGKDGSHPKPQDIKHKIAEETDVSMLHSSGGDHVHDGGGGGDGAMISSESHAGLRSGPIPPSYCLASHYFIISDVLKWLTLITGG